MNKSGAAPSFGEAAKALGVLFDQGAQVGMSLLGPLVSSSAKLVGGMLQSATSPHGSKCTCGACSCHIPPPCWQPEQLCDVETEVCPGGTATIRIRVSNCDMKPHKIQFTTTGQNTGVTITPPSLTLGPMERGYVAVSLPLPAGAGPGEHREILIWIRGCKDHFLRWTVEVTHKGLTECAGEVDVDDCPDYLHHWYDHFYCHRNCTHDDKQG